jgi:hypothetical protein
MSEPLAELIDRITRWPYGMPVRLMERALAMGPAAIPELASALAACRDDEERDALWLIVLLGETRHPDAVAPLVAQMRRTELDVLSEAAGEGLAKIGAAAVPALLEVARTGDERERLAAYVTLGRIPDERSFGALADALGRERRLADVVAVALGEQGRPEAIAALDRSYRECEPWQRPEFEGTLWSLHHRSPSPAAWREDWRLRYRRVPELEDNIRPDLLAMYGIVHAQGGSLADRPTQPIRPLDEILAGGSDEDEPEETCPECGAPVESYTGLPACPETAVGTAVFQLEFLAGAREDGIEDLFELLDEVEADQQDRLDAGEPRGPKARDRRRNELDELAMCRETCIWLVERGVESVERGRALLLDEAARLAETFGDPEGLLEPARPVRLAGPKIGRNDPCPCGSGRKYKRCCLAKA